MSQEIFTFWNGNSLFAVEVSSILSTQQYLADEKPLPVQGRGLKGSVMYRGQPTPIFDFADSVGLPSPFEENHELIQLLGDKEKDHVEWINALEDSLLNGVPFTKDINPHKCAFGQWFESYQTRDDDFKVLISKFEEPHDRIHALAGQLFELRDKGETEQALQILADEKMLTLSKMVRLFEEARRYLKTNERPVVMFVTRDGIKPLLGLVINQIADVQMISSEDIMPLDDTSIGSIITGDRVGPMIKGFIRKEGLECLLLEPERLLEVA